jgi:hypothetical protein
VPRALFTLAFTMIWAAPRALFAIAFSMIWAFMVRFIYGAMRP